MAPKSTVTTDHKWLQLPDETVARYNAYDCLATARAKRAIRQHLHSNGQLGYFEREVWSLVPAVLAMQRRGLPYDSMAKGQYRKRLRRELAQCDQRLRELYAETADYQAELDEVIRIEFLVKQPPEGPEGRKYRARQAKGITLTKAERDKLGRRLPATWNPNSDDQVRRWLFEDLGLRPSTTTAGGKQSVDMDALSRIYRNLRKKDEHARPALHDLMHRARLQKIDQDYLDPEVRHGQEGITPTRENEVPRTGDGYVQTHGRATKWDQQDSPEGAGSLFGLCNKSQESVGSVGQRRRAATSGRVYPTIKMTGTETGRFSYADPPIHSWPDEVRHLVCPGEGRVWLGADYQQIEARVFAILTNDQRDLAIYRRFDEVPGDKEWDIHWRTACELFGLTIGELLSKPDTQLAGMRTYSKNFRYGVLLYGGGPTSTKAKVGCPCPRCVDKAPPTVEVTPAERKRHADRWFTQHPNVQLWRERISQEVRGTHTLRGPMGQKWYFMSPWGRDVQREAWNRIIQGTAATIIHRAMRKLHDLGCPLCLQHHDALYLECDEGDADRWAQTMRKVMEEPVPELENRVFPVDLMVGPSWGEMREYEHQALQ